MAEKRILHLSVDGEITIPKGPELELIQQPLHKALTFENSVWRRKAERNLPCDDIPQYRSAYYKDTEGNWKVARGAWRIISTLAATQDIELYWESRVIHPNDRSAAFQLDAELRPYQQASLNALLHAKGGVVVIPTGGGKTMVALAIAAALQTRTLFIVHTRELLEQTIKSAERFLGTKAGVIGSGKWKIAPFTVALIQTLARRDLSEIKDEFGLVIIDEAHHAPAQSYCQILPLFPARYRVALTATPYRKDGLHKLLWLQFGDIVYQIAKKDLEQHNQILAPVIHPVTTEFDYMYDDDFTQMISIMCSNKARQKLVVDTIRETHRPGGCSLVLTERVNHAIKLADGLKDANMPVSLLHGKLSSKARSKSMEDLTSGESEILVATLSLIGEGWDHPPLDTLYLTVPNGNRTKTTQALGRILRPYPGKLEPRVYDFVDYRVGILRHHWMVRSRVYGLDPSICRRALKLPAFPSTPPPPPSPRVPSDKIGDLLQAVREGRFGAAQDILDEHKKK